MTAPDPAAVELAALRAVRDGVLNVVRDAEARKPGWADDLFRLGELAKAVPSPAQDALEAVAAVTALPAELTRAFVGDDAIEEWTAEVRAWEALLLPRLSERLRDVVGFTERRARARISGLIAVLTGAALTYSGMASAMDPGARPHIDAYWKKVSREWPERVLGADIRYRHRLDQRGASGPTTPDKGGGTSPA